MSSRWNAKERRQSRRVATALDVVLAGLGPDATPVEARALNLSAGGVYVETPGYVTPLTKVELTLVLPPFGQDAAGGGAESAPKERATASIRAEGFVVRCEPDGREPERYLVGIAFLHLSPADRSRIEAYVNWRLERSLIESAGG
jgi:c-di-GMP-binding flagellar brake protein YcgR